jgi:hypothetical protein
MKSTNSSDARVRVARNLSELEPFRNAVAELALAAIEPNVFYEPFMLMPALKWLAADDDLRLVLVSREVSGGTKQDLIGFFPLQIRQTYNHFPIKTARLWKHKFCYSCSPLLHREYAEEALNGFMQWLGSEPGNGHLLELGMFRGHGPVHDLFVGWLWNTHRPSLVDERWTRPCLQRGACAESYLHTAMSSRHRKSLEKKEKKLRQMGALEYVLPNSEAEVTQWIEDFLTIERNGWRGKRGTDCCSWPGGAEFLRDALLEAWRCQCLNMLGLRLSSKLIAIKINLTAPGGNFAFMITYDEAFSAYSPGLLLEVENLRLFHDNPAFIWMDSCADQNSPLFTRVWTGKTVIETLLISQGSRTGDFWISAIPFGHFLRHRVMPKLFGGLRGEEQHDTQADEFEGQQKQDLVQSGCIGKSENNANVQLEHPDCGSNSEITNLSGVS